MAVAKSVRLFLTGLVVVSMGCTATWTAAMKPVPSDEREWVEWPLTAPPAVSAELAPPKQKAPARPANRLVSRARTLVGLSTLRVAAPHLPDDCTGLVRAVYEDSGIELMGAGVRGDNGVTAMWRYAFERSALHNEPPQPGDLVFFRETYDRNRDGKHNDGLTHVGVVEAVDGSGTVSFVHRVNGGVKRSKLNMSAPSDRKRNDYLRPAKKDSPAQLTGELFVTFASAWRLSRTELTEAERPPRGRVGPFN
jgi:hypothetical protein